MVQPGQYEAVRRGAALIDRSGRGRLLLTGADRRSYLQGLLTNDIAALGPGTGCYAALLTPQGRMLADMRVLEMGDAILIDLDPAVTAMVRDRLDQFIFSEDVQVADITSGRGQLGVYGPEAPGVVAGALAAGRSPEEQPPRRELLEDMGLHESTRWDFGGTPVYLARSDDPGVPGFELFVETAVRDRLAGSLVDAGAIAVDPEVIEVVRVESGRPLFGVDMTSETIPLEAGIEDRAISLTKGCYVGQEIIIRVLHRGQGRVARRLVGLALEPGAPVPSRGDRVLSGDREIGAVTSAVSSPRLGRPIALGYVHRDFTAPGTPVSVAGLPAVVSALPFA